jgi:hypothetical protein
MCVRKRTGVNFQDFLFCRGGSAKWMQQCSIKKKMFRGSQPVKDEMLFCHTALKKLKNDGPEAKNPVCLLWDMLFYKMKMLFGKEKSIKTTAFCQIIPGRAVFYILMGAV